MAEPTPLLTGDLMRAEFNGTGTLSGYSPDVGSNLILSTLAGYDASLPHAPLTACVRTGTGQWKWDYNNPTDRQTMLQLSTAPIQADYHAEITFKLPATVNPANDFPLGCFLSGRSINDGFGTLQGIGVAIQFEMGGPVGVYTLTAQARTHQSNLVDIDYGPEEIFHEPVTLGSVYTIAAEWVGRSLRIFLNGVLRSVATWTSNYFDAKGTVAWSFYWFGPNGFPTPALYAPIQIERMQVGYNYVPPMGIDWLKAEFNGASNLNLTTYVPEINTLIVPTVPADNSGGFVPDIDATGHMLDGTGALYVTVLTQSVQDNILSIAPVSAPPRNDYYHEVVLKFPSVASLTTAYPNSWPVNITLLSRESIDPTNPPFLYGLMMRLNFDANGGNWWVFPEMQDKGLPTIDYDDWWNFDGINFGSAAFTATFRVQVKGRMWNFWVNGVKQASHGVKDFYWSGSSIFDTGSGRFAINSNYTSQTSGTPCAPKVEAYRAGDYPEEIIPGAFWAQKVKCTEVIGATTFMRAPAIIEPELRRPLVTPLLMPSFADLLAYAVSRREVVTPLAVGDFQRAEFIGTGTLQAYVPEVGPNFVTRTSPAQPLVGTGGTQAITEAARVTSGSWVFDHNTGWNAKFLALKCNVTPTSADYRVEIIVSTPNSSFYDMEIALCGRGYLSAFDGAILRTYAPVFTISRVGGATQVFVQPKMTQDSGNAVLTNPTGNVTVALGATAQQIILAAEFQGNTLRAFVNNTVRWTATLTGSTEFNAAGIVEWQFNFPTWASGDPRYALTAVERQRATYDFAVAAPGTEFMLANFNGTGNLNNYTPDVGAPFVWENRVANGGSQWPISFYPCVLQGDGTWKFDQTNIDGDIITIRGGTNPPVLDYFMETVIQVGSEATVIVHHDIRATNYDYSPTEHYYESIPMHFYINGYVGGDPTKVDIGVTFVGTFYSNAVFVGDPSQVTGYIGPNVIFTLATAVKGREVRNYINGMLVQTLTWSGGTEYDTPGMCVWGFNFLNPGGVGGTYFPAPIFSMRAGTGVYDSIRPDPEAFWTTRVKCSEVISYVGTRQAPVVIEELAQPEPVPVLVMPSAAELLAYAQPRVIPPLAVIPAGFDTPQFVDADFTNPGVPFNTLLNNYTDKLGRTFSVPYYENSGFTDINYSIGVVAPGVNDTPVLTGCVSSSSTTAPGSLSNRTAYADVTIPGGTDHTVAVGFRVGPMSSFDNCQAMLIARADTQDWGNGPPRNRISVTFDCKGADISIPNYNYPGYIDVTLRQDTQVGYTSVTKRVDTGMALYGQLEGVQLRMSGNVAKLFMEGVTENPDAGFTEVLSLSITWLAPGFAGFATSGIFSTNTHDYPGNITIGYFKVYTEDPPGNFWTTRVRCTEEVTP